MVRSIVRTVSVVAVCLGGTRCESDPPLGDSTKRGMKRSRQDGSAAAAAWTVALLSVGAVPCAASQQPGEWTIAPEPSWRAGWSANAPETEFYDIVSVVELADGSIAVADRGLARIVVIDADGTVRQTLGRAGDGPGEFAGLAQVFADDDGGIYAFDVRQQRLTRWSLKSGVLRSTTLSRAAFGRRMSGAGRLGSGELYVWEAPRLEASHPGDVVRDVVGIHRLSGDGIVGDRLVAIPGMYATQFEVQGQVGIRSVMFSPRALHTQLGRCILSMPGDGTSITVTRVAGAGGDARIPLPFPAQPTDESDRRKWVEGTAAANDAPPEAIRMLEAVASELAMVDRFPVANRIIGDPAGYVWLERYAPPEGPSGDWSVLDGRGAVVGEIALPEGFRLMGVTDDRIIGVWSDDLGRQEVRAYALRRSRGDPGSPLADCRNQAVVPGRLPVVLAALMPPGSDHRSPNRWPAFPPSTMPVRSRPDHGYAVDGTRCCTYAERIRYRF